MSKKRLEIGTLWNVRVKIIKHDFGEDGEIAAVTVDEQGVANDVEYSWFAPCEINAFSPITPENGIKNTEATPKHDPCRLLKKGDRVQVKMRNGRCNGKDGEYLREAFCTVAEDETQNELVRVLHNATEYRLDPAYLELITPVEEPYSVGVTVHSLIVFKGTPDNIVAKYNNSHPHAKEAAEAERDRLNAELRQEQI